ncbi:MAG: hypothetical protein AAGH41_03860 [Pseudomonadota bacterium]
MMLARAVVAAGLIPTPTAGRAAPCPMGVEVVGENRELTPAWHAPSVTSVAHGG